MQQLRRELEAAGFAELPEDLRRPPDANQPSPDVVKYAITADGHTVRALGSALPAELLPVVEALNVILQRESSEQVKRWTCPASNYDHAALVCLQRLAAMPN